jgi:hypothetical protein
VAAQLATLTQFEDSDLEDPRSIIEVCNANLTLARDFLLTLKESNAKRQNTLLALDLIQRGLVALLACKFESTPTTQGSSLDEKRICDIVREAVSSQLCNTTAGPCLGIRAPKI